MKLGRVTPAPAPASGTASSQHASSDIPKQEHQVLKKKYKVFLKRSHNREEEMPQSPGPKGVEFPELHAVWRWPGPTEPSSHPGVQAGAGWWSWGPRADRLLCSPPFSSSCISPFSFRLYCPLGSSGTVWLRVQYIHAFTSAHTRPQTHTLTADHKGGTYSKLFYLPVSGTVLCAVNLNGFSFHFRFFFTLVN